MQSMHGVLGSVLVLGLTWPGRTVMERPTSAFSVPAPPVRPGIEVLVRDSLHLVRGRRVGLVTNQAGVDREGLSDVERLRRAGVRLVALFSPEHGFRGIAGPGAPVATTTDSATGLPIYSLYGRTSAPTDAMLDGIDVLLVDLQDAGARYYTYLWTTTEVMRAAAGKGIPVVVLDRPNPIGGAVQGNVLDTAFRSPVGLVAIPMRHGMTLAELARLANDELSLKASLAVVPAAGWRRTMYFEETGLPFVPPSPNLRSIEALIHYPGVCLFEGTTLSVGRGTDHPFEQIGAPWLDTLRVLALLRRADVAGVAFSGVSFTPRQPGDGKYADTLVIGIRLRVTDRGRYDPTMTAMALLDAVAASARASGRPIFPSSRAHFERLLASGRPDSSDPYTSGGWLRLTRSWAGEDSAFRIRRRPYLLYPEH
jgi:uncharacterized protein YbbC (DUF1343 family)